jgi:cyclomaltodextrin glucanotransferase
MNGMNDEAERDAAPVPMSQIHLSDVEFRGEMIYFAVLDRFCDGCHDNLGKRSDLNDPTRQDWNKYWGGDLQGLLDKLDYLQGFGVTAIWVTPLFEQVEAMERDRNRAPIHGYWTQDFKRINARWVNDPENVRLFERDDTIFDRLLREMHSRGMKFILDIVCNHSSPPTEDGKGRLFDDGRLIADYENDKDNWYHHYGPVTNWEDEWQVQNCEMEGLATFNENNILYRRYIKEALKLWLDKGVDAIRIDTVKHMPIWFWQELNSDLQTHKPDVFIFGEWIYSHPKNPASVIFANQAGMSLLDFGLCQAIRECLGENKPEGFKLVQELLDEDDKYRGATELVTFFENHDMPRLQSLDGRNETMHTAIVLLLTTRGIPCLYYGSEQYLHNDTEGGNDPYNRPMMEKWEETEACRLIGVLSRERTGNPALQWGGQWPKVVEPGLFSYLRRYRGSRCLVILNREGERDAIIPDVQLPDGNHRCLLTGRDVAAASGEIRISMKPHEALVLCVRDAPVTGRSVVRIQINGAPTQPGQRLAVIGDCPELGEWDLRNAQDLECINKNTWFGEIVFDASAGKSVAYKYVIFPADEVASPCREIRTTRRRAVACDGVAKWRDVWEE